MARIPLGLNRWVYLALLCVYILFSGPTIMNWPPLRKMLVSSGVYAWRCGLEDVLDDQGTCSAQRKALALCGNLAQTMMFVGSSIAGGIADSFGPKVVSAVGGCLVTLAYLLLALSSQKTQLYIPSYFFNGLAIEFCFFGLLTVPNCFPHNRQLALTILGSARSLSMLYSMMQSSIFDPEKFSLPKVGWTCVCISIFFTAVGWFLIPWTPFALKQSPVTRDLTDAEKETDSLIEARDNSLMVVPAKGLESLKFRYFLQKLLGLCYVTWLVIFAISFCRGQFYGLSVDDQSPQVSRAFSILSPLSFIPCPIFGFLADKFGMMVVLIILNSIATIMYISLVTGPTTAGAWIAVFGSCFFLSFLASQNYCWIQENYNYLVQGRLAGLAMCFVGLISLVNTPLYSWGTDHDGFTKINWMYLGLSIANFGLLYLMWMLKGETNLECFTSRTASCYDDPDTVLKPGSPAVKNRTPSTAAVLTAQKESVV